MMDEITFERIQICRESGDRLLRLYQYSGMTWTGFTNLLLFCYVLQYSKCLGKEEDLGFV